MLYVPQYDNEEKFASINTKSFKFRPHGDMLELPGGVYHVCRKNTIKAFILYRDFNISALGS